MNWSFAGDIQSRVEQFEREVLRYETRSGEKIKDVLEEAEIMHEHTELSRIS